MKRLVAGTLLLLITGSANAQGVNLAWDDCSSVAPTNKVFACSTNVGSEDLVASFVPPVVSDPVFAIGTVLRIQTPDDAVLPDWWMLGSGLCRSGSLQFGFAAADGPGCTAIGQLPDSVRFSFTTPLGLANRAELGIGAYYSPGLVNLNQSTEYLAARVELLNVRATGNGACSGCADHATITLDRIVLETNGTPLTIRFPLRQSVVTWQGGTVPTLPRSWGQVKALYR